MRGKEMLQTAGLLYATYELSKFAFTIRARKEIGERDSWTCQGREEEPCVWEYSKLGEPASFQAGFMVTAAHYPDLHRDKDQDPSRGRILCQCCHALEELGRDNQWGAEKLLEMGVFHVNHHRETGQQWYPTLEELRELESRVHEQQNQNNREIGHREDYTHAAR